MAHRTIKTKVHEGYVQEEGTLTAVAVYPGMILERTAAGTFQAHSSAAGNAEVLVCVEDEGQGKGITDVYAASSHVTFIAARKGDKFALRMSNADSSTLGTIVIGDFLESDGAGHLRVGTTLPLAIALEAIDMADSSGVHGSGHIAARVL